jgi:hypothetical protein
MMSMAFFVARPKRMNFGYGEGKWRNKHTKHDAKTFDSPLSNHRNKPLRKIYTDALICSNEETVNANQITFIGSARNPCARHSPLPRPLLLRDGAGRGK